MTIQKITIKIFFIAIIEYGSPNRKSNQNSVALIPDQATLRVIRQTPINCSSIKDKTHCRHMERIFKRNE